MCVGSGFFARDPERATNGGLLLARHHGELKVFPASTKVDGDGEPASEEFYDRVKINGNGDFNGIEILDAVEPLQALGDSIGSDMRRLNGLVRVKKFGGYFVTVSSVMHDDAAAGEHAGDVISSCVLFKKAPEQTYFETLDMMFEADPSAVAIELGDLLTEGESGFLPGRCYDPDSHSGFDHPFNSAMGVIASPAKILLNTAQGEPVDYFDGQYYRYADLLLWDGMVPVRPSASTGAMVVAENDMQRYEVKRLDQDGSPWFLARVRDVSTGWPRTQIVCEVQKGNPAIVSSDHDGHFYGMRWEATPRKPSPAPGQNDNTLNGLLHQPHPHRR